eukprot:TRINITY_DN1005_c8_g1_i1.p1 TRINITY_DN1005_c8_g1~~TRINITY_DN1005_c8_g1_i1.p1  ORF type:complete len:369 (+),score=74.70 TRINITY_DN1005_c8_g1_i1:75-1109(+)
MQRPQYRPQGKKEGRGSVVTHHKRVTPQQQQQQQHPSRQPPMLDTSNQSQEDEQRTEAKEPLSRIGRDIRLTKRMLQHATKLALADNNQQVEMEKWNLTQVERAMKEKKSLEESLQTQSTTSTPEEYINRERGWWDQHLSSWSVKREEVRHEMERRALEKLLSTQSPDQLQELQDPKAAQQWLQLMEASLHPFISELNKTMTSEQPVSPNRQARVLVPTKGELEPSETKSGLWCTVPKTVEKYVSERKQNLSRTDWSNGFKEGDIGAQGESQDRYWNPSAPVSPSRASRSTRSSGGTPRMVKTANKRTPNGGTASGAKPLPHVYQQQQHPSQSSRGYHPGQRLW